MHWNHRVIRKEGREDLAIHEVYYDESHNPIMVADDPVRIFGETVDEIKETLERMLRSLNTPILSFESIGEETVSNEKIKDE